MMASRRVVTKATGAAKGFSITRLISAVSLFVVGFMVGRMGGSLEGAATTTSGATTTTKQNTLVPQHFSGWKSIHVFFGQESAVVPTRPGWHSQFGQDRAVYQLLNDKKGGFFVDLAANEPAFISNSLSLERDHGWTGICIEPKSWIWFKLAHRKCALVGAVVSNANNTEITFRYKLPTQINPDGILPEGGHSGIVGNDPQLRHHETDKPRDGVWKDEKRRTATLLDILEKLEAPKVMDYLSLDVEGAEDFVMSAFPFDKYTFLTLTVETPSQALQTLLTSKGYKMVKKLREDELWAHNTVET